MENQMANAAILVGNTEYRSLPPLACCDHDLIAIRQLLEATEKYESIVVINNAAADDLKQRLRDAIDKIKTPGELFFYFTGHGYARDGELFHCATNFDGARPNETGLSTSELHTILRLADAALVVKLIDTCYSGTPLIKSEMDWVRQTKDGFHNIIQIASCLESQNSLAGRPLSVFTGKFRDAALRKVEGVVFYTDIISTLRDEFIEDSSQTPHFIAQHTGREQFVDDAKKLDSLRKVLEDARAASAVPAVQTSAQAVVPSPTLVDRLRAADARVVTPGIMSEFVGKFFDDLIQKITTAEFVEFFEAERTEHAGFEEATAKQFIIRVMSKEKRADNFVTAEFDQKPRTRNAFLRGVLPAYMDPAGYDEVWDLHLNCTMERTQLKIIFTPKFTNLQRITLVVTCVPSLDYCYIFEVATQHMLRDFGKYDPDGSEISRRWWKRKWREGSGGTANQISKKFAEVVRNQLESAEKRLAGEV
jgi:hypothetical protein